MKKENILAQINAVLHLQEAINAGGSLYQPALVRAQCERVYGRPVEYTTWRRWLNKCCVTDALVGRYGGMYPEGVRVFLLANAKLLQGNGPNERSKRFSRMALVGAVKAMKLPLLPEELPGLVTGQRLRELADAQAGHVFSKSAHKQRGVLIGPPNRPKVYSREEAAAILATYPTADLRAHCCH